jgi:uncharacterized protein (DUF169 family)
MPTYIEQALGLKYPPLAIFYAQQLPGAAKLSKTMCAMFLVAQAAKGETVVLGPRTCACPGAASGFGLEPMSARHFPGGHECFTRFLSIGNKGWAPGEAVIRQLQESGAPKIMLEEFTEGEGFFKTPELVDEWMQSLPGQQQKAEGPYVIIKPLRDVAPTEQTKVVSFLVNPQQLSALVVLANFARPGTDNVRIPFGPGCAGFGLYAFAETARENPKAIVGLTDISARFYLRQSLGPDLLSFTMPLNLYEEMEANAPQSFLTRLVWKSMMKNS